MALTPFFWARVFEKHGSRGLSIALGIAFIISIILYIIYRFVIPTFFDLPAISEVLVGFILTLIGLVVFFVLYWKFVKQKS